MAWEAHFFVQSGKGRRVSAVITTPSAYRTAFSMYTLLPLARFDRMYMPSLQHESQMNRNLCRRRLDWMFTRLSHHDCDVCFHASGELIPDDPRMVGAEGHGVAHGSLESLLLKSRQSAQVKCAALLPSNPRTQKPPQKTYIVCSLKHVQDLIWSAKVLQQSNRALSPRYTRSEESECGMVVC